MINKLLVSIALLLFTCAGLYAQHDGNGCDATFTPAQTRWLKDFQARKQFGLPLRKDRTYIPIIAHIVGNDQGQGYFYPAYLFDLICNINTDYTPIGFYFYLKGDIDYINSSALFNFDYNTFGEIIAPTQDAEAINIYFVSSTPGFCGVYIGWSDIIVIKNSCGNPGSNTLTHELGHFFSLPHTFSGWENNNTPVASNQERADGSNCSNAGDGFCDTRADYLSNRWDCPYAGVLKDPAGQAISPDGSLYMSYSNDACMTRFSDEQLAAMVANRQNRGISGAVSATDTLGITAQLTPLVNETLSGNSCRFSWNKLQGAMQYELQVVNIGGYLLPLYDIVTADTTYLLQGLPVSRPLEWRVRGLYPGMSCSPFSGSRKLRTADVPTGIARVGEKIVFTAGPNPLAAGETLHIEGVSVITSAALYNLDGICLYKADPGSSLLSIPAPAAGFYLLRVSTQEGSGVMKIVVR